MGLEKTRFLPKRKVNTMFLPPPSLPRVVVDAEDRFLGKSPPSQGPFCFSVRGRCEDLAPERLLFDYHNAGTLRWQSAEDQISRPPVGKRALGGGMAR